MQTLLRNLFTLLTKIKRQAISLEDPMVLAQFNKVEKEAKKLKSLIAAASKK